LSKGHSTRTENDGKQEQALFRCGDCPNRGRERNCVDLLGRGEDQQRARPDDETRYTRQMIDCGAKKFFAARGLLDDHLLIAIVYGQQTLSAIAS
jgi:hypothetical protein